MFRNKRPLLCYLFHAWNFIESKSTSRKLATICIRCGARKDFLRVD